MKEYWYRYEENIYSAGIDSFGDVIPGLGSISVTLRKYLVAKHTPKGVWLCLSYYFNEATNVDLPCDRFVLKDARKRFACPSKEDAIESFIKRKSRQVSILKSQLDIAQNAIEIGLILQKTINNLKQSVEDDNSNEWDLDDE